MCAYTHLPTGWPDTSFVHNVLTRSLAPLPLIRKSPMWETSNAPAVVRTAMCSSIMVVYWMGMSHPANQTILAPSFTCSSCIGVLCIEPA
jgi:hypothetical protein